MKKKAEFKYKLELQKKQNQWKKDFEYLTIKVNKKRDAYISKKEKEYHKRMPSYTNSHPARFPSSHYY